MLKIDGAGTEGPPPPDSSGKQQSRRPSAKKLGTYPVGPCPPREAPADPGPYCCLPPCPSAAHMSAPQSEAPAAPRAVLSSTVSELLQACAALGMAPPEFHYASKQQVAGPPWQEVPRRGAAGLTRVLTSPQGPLICQVKLSNGLVVHGPQCQSESEAKEHAAFIALQRLVHTHTHTHTHTRLLKHTLLNHGFLQNSVGAGFPLPPALYPGVGHAPRPALGAVHPVFSPQGQWACRGPVAAETQRRVWLCVCGGRSLNMASPGVEQLRRFLLPKFMTPEVQWPSEQLLPNIQT